MRLIATILLLMVCLTSWSQKTLHIFGGKDHDVYLGCLNCDSYNKNSIWNTYGTFGSKYNTNSIWNTYSNYGSQYSQLSPFNSYATTPPVIVDPEGGFYGYFTVNEYNSRRANFTLVQIIYQYHDLIKDDIPKWYDKIFNN